MQYNMKQLNIYLKSKAPIMFTSKKKKREKSDERANGVDAVSEQLDNSSQCPQHGV